MIKLLFFGVLFTATIALSSQEPLKVSIFYEALCPDSISFIAQQFAPNYDTLAEKITVDFLPYGLGSHELINGVYHFQCQHGENECYGNMMQACGLNETNDQATKAKFIICVMSASNPASTALMEECAIASGISWNNMVECSKNGVGATLLAAYGDRTHAVEPCMTFVPTIIYNDVYDADKQDKSLVDFLNTVLNQL
nr:GILT-like protein 1 isoform X1 [Onthophagus taurus]XP_022910311.1 GILT-like protein 1 isoform X2 [Onthophagus taurus]XP_022910312.1 GILT-like protein 1 isoform X3 [Onthophagus taurus]